jgi:hypothetical protein
VVVQMDQVRAQFALSLLSEHLDLDSVEDAYVDVAPAAAAAAAAAAARERDRGREGKSGLSSGSGSEPGAGSGAAFAAPSAARQALGAERLSRVCAVWLFALLAKLDKPINAPVASMLRMLYRRLAAVRATQTQANETVAYANMLLTIVDKTFAQRVE